MTNALLAVVLCLMILLAGVIAGGVEIDVTVDGKTWHAGGPALRAVIADPAAVVWASP